MCTTEWINSKLFTVVILGLGIMHNFYFLCSAYLASLDFPQLTCYLLIKRKKLKFLITY